ncbi:MAG: hypothetical protein K8Q89_01145 [Nitrosarchaeum sp.]|nr:hypothetical protein [Nitrosarchaeum sp.]
MKSIFVISLLTIFSIIPIQSFADDTSVLEETTIQMSIPSDNHIPWGFVEGKITSQVKDYPVIIQIYKDDKPVHFAQVPVSDDGTYQYRFRVLDVTDNKTTKIFEGDYTVKIFKVVDLDSNYVDSLLERQTPGTITIDVTKQNI